MKRKLIYISVLMLIVLGWFGWNEYSTQALHKEITVDEVSEIKLWGSKERIASNEEAKKIIGWFNNIKDIRENEKLSGSTPSSGIIIKLKSGEEILILRSGEEFEVQRNEGSYWGKQSNIKELLNQLA